MSATGGRRLLLAGLLLVAVVVGSRGWRDGQMSRLAEQTCDLAEVDPAGALEKSAGLAEHLSADDPLLPIVVSCRCEALSRAGDLGECATLVDGTLARAGSAWITPEELEKLAPNLSSAGVEATLDRLLPAAATRFPLSAAVLRTWFVVQTRTRAPNLIAATLAPHLGRLPAAETTNLRAALAMVLDDRDVEAALTAMGPAPAGDDPHRDLWFSTRVNLYAQVGRQPDVVRTMDAWVKAGVHPDVADLYYGIALSLNHLTDAYRSNNQILREGVEKAPPETPAVYLEIAYARLIMAAANNDVPAQAQQLAEAAARRGVYVDPAMLGEATRGAPATARHLDIVVRIPDPLPGDMVWFTPADPEVADAPAGGVEAVGGVARWRTTLLDRATRWVARDAAGRLLGSGSVLAPPEEASVVVSLPERAPIPTLEPPDLGAGRAPADGERQVFVVIVDCADWNMARYLGARSDLPWISALEQAGIAGVLTSEPAFTGVAMEKIAHPSVTVGLTVTQYLYQLGVELQGLESVGVNPLAPLAWVLPESPYLVDLVGAGQHRALNLLFSHGDIDAGRNAEVVGPLGARNTVKIGMRRPLRPEEEAVALRGGTVSETGGRFLQEMAAELDTAVEHVASGDIDLLLLRVEQTDLLTHGTYATTNRTEVDQGRGDLYAAYRYVDLRIGEIVRATDADDVVIVMSDHGIENALVHSPHAMFITYGLGKTARLLGSPEIAGLPRLLTALLGVTPDPRWPETTLVEQVLGEDGLVGD